MYAINLETNQIVWPCEASNSYENLRCPSCSKQVIFRKGEINRPHFAHKPCDSSNGESQNCEIYCDRRGGGGEGNRHAIAKLLLASYLASNNTVELSIECERCFKSEKIYISLKLYNANNVKTEVKCTNGIADIVLLSDSQIRLIIEIKDTHATKFRAENWFEVSASEVIEQLVKDNSLKEISNLITLRSLKYRRCTTECKSMLDLAKELGYYTIENEKPSIDVLITASCKKDLQYNITASWNVEGISILKRSESMQEFLNRKRCLYCTKSYMSSAYKVFCYACYTHILSNPRIILETRKSDIKYRNQFRWLESIPENKNSPCIFCQSPRNSKIWYYGYRQVCVQCIQNNN